MTGTWVWIVALGAAVWHALRWVPGNATMRQVKIPAAFVVLYVVYAGAQVVGGLAGVLVAVAVVEGGLQVMRRARPRPPESPARGAPGTRRR